MPITTGSVPLSLPGNLSEVSKLSDDREPLEAASERNVPKANKKPPKKHAFGPTKPGAAFRK